MEKKKGFLELTKKQWIGVTAVTLMAWIIILSVDSKVDARKSQYAEGTVEHLIEATVLKPKWKVIDLQAPEQVDGGLGISLNVQLEDPPFMAKFAVLTDLQKILKGFQELGKKQKINVVYIRPFLTLQKVDGNTEVGKVGSLVMKYADFKDANLDNLTAEQFEQFVISKGELRLHNALR